MSSPSGSLVEHRDVAPEPAGLLLAVVAATGIGMLGTNTLPLILGSVIDELGIAESRAGLMGTVELGALALVSLVMAPRVGRLPRSRLAVLGGVVVVAGYVLSALAEGYSTILLGRLICGAGAGVVMAVGNAAIAASEDPDGLMARLMLVGGVAAVFLLGVLPLAIEPWGYGGAFAVLAVVAALCIPFARRLPPAPGESSIPVAHSMNRKWLGVALLFGIMIDATSQDGLWTFSERIGIGAGLNVEEVGIVLASTTLAGLAGAALAFVLGTRFGRAAPICFGLGLGALSRWLLANASEPSTYWVAQLLLGLSFFLTYPFLFGAIAALDPTGRWAAAGAGIATIGTALGPAVAGVLVEAEGYPALGGLGIAAAACTAVLVIPVALSLERSPVETARGL